MNANLKGWLQALQLRIQFYEMVFLHEYLEYDFFSVVVWIMKFFRKRSDY